METQLLSRESGEVRRDEPRTSMCDSNIGAISSSFELSYVPPKSRAHVEGQVGMHQRTFRFVLLQVERLRHLHEHHYVHRDVKPGAWP